MKTSANKLPKFFHRLFAVLEVLVPAVNLTLCILVLAVPSLLHNVQMEVELGQVGLLPESGALTASGGNTNAETITIKNLQGTVSVKSSTDTGGVFAFTRAATLPMFIAYAAFLTVLFDLLRRLFRSVVLGETFSDRTVHLVQKIGVTIIIFALLSAAARTWHNRAVANYLGEHATVQGIKLAFTPPQGRDVLVVNSTHFDFQFGWEGIFTGVLVLALGEVFRQGLALKKENDLTV
jgi:hypothetical protein